MEDRLRCPALRDKLMGADEAAGLIRDGMTVAVSGFTPSGCPKAVPLALAAQVRAGRRLRLGLLTGASTGDEIDTAWGELDMIARRFPYITSAALRRSVNGGGGAGVAFLDQHLGMMAQNTRMGFYGPVDVAILEAAAITEEGGLVPTTAVGCSQAFADCAASVIVELNLAQPAALEGFHDICRIADPPHRQPIPLTDVAQRIGRPYISCDPAKIAAVVVSRCPEKPRPLAPEDGVSRGIAARLMEFLAAEKAAGRPSAGALPLQSGVGSVANAVLLGLRDSGFRHLRFYSEVMQDGVLDLMDRGVADFCSATSLSLSEAGMARLLGDLERYRGRIVLRDSEVSNSGEVIRRLGVIAMNTAIEADIFGNVNSTHMQGCKVYNGIGGSGDYARNAAVTIFMTGSVARGGRVSCIVPMVSHCDHTEHDVDVLVTEQGWADLRGRSPKERARLVIERCAHPDFRPLLRDYLARAEAELGGVQTPQLLSHCFDLHERYRNTGSMLETTETGGSDGRSV